MAKHIIYFDGGARGNHDTTIVSEAAWAFVDETEHHGQGNCVKGRTNNEMEYQALINGLRHARKRGYKTVEMRGDSKLVVEQVNGRWKCKADNLKPYLAEANRVLSELGTAGTIVDIVWVPREQNKADKFYNQLLDRKEQSAIVTDVRGDIKARLTPMQNEVYDTLCAAGLDPVQMCTVDALVLMLLDGQ